MRKNFQKQRYTINDAKLSKYILDKSLKNKQLPYMTKIAQETKISVATISRYAKRRGYYSFGDMRANFNKKLGQDHFNDKGLVDFFLNQKSIVIISSKFTEVISYLIKNRLSDLKIASRIYNHGQKIEKDDSVIAITLSGSSLKVNKFISQNPKNNIKLLTTMKKEVDSKNIEVISLDKFMYTQDDRYEGHKIIRNLFNWMDDVLNIVHIRKTTNFNN